MFATAVRICRRRYAVIDNQSQPFVGKQCERSCRLLERGVQTALVGQRLLDRQLFILINLRLIVMLADRAHEVTVPEQPSRCQEDVAHLLAVVKVELLKRLEIGCRWGIVVEVCEQAVDLMRQPQQVAVDGRHKSHEAEMRLQRVPGNELHVDLIQLRVDISVRLIVERHWTPVEMTAHFDKRTPESGICHYILKISHKVECHALAQSFAHFGQHLHASPQFVDILCQHQVVVVCRMPGVRIWKHTLQIIYSDFHFFKDCIVSSIACIHRFASRCAATCSCAAAGRCRFLP